MKRLLAAVGLALPHLVLATAGAQIDVPVFDRPARAPVPGEGPPPPALPAPDPATAAGLTDQNDAALIAAQAQQSAELFARPQTVSFAGYIDFGFFAPQGNGAGYVQDVGHQVLPEYAGRYSWVFLGDILAPAVNTRGEAADLGDAPGAERFDSVNSRGSPGFIVNELNLRMAARPAPNAIITASVNLMPRTGSDFSFGDFFDVDLAQLEWLPTEARTTSIFVGKVDSVLGIEYRERKSDRRFGITPSLLARYTTGTALGLKVRSKVGPSERLIIAAAITNGSNTTEQFHFYDELDSNAAKTGSARLSLQLPIPGSAELGISGSYGGQDRTLSNEHAMWFFGPDLLIDAGPFSVKAQWLKGRAAGDPAAGAYQLDLHHGGYLELDWAGGSGLGVLGRLEYRNAFVALGTERAYVTKSWRGTVGGRWIASRWAALKAEYLHNGSFGNLPTVRSDVFTSSVVLSY